MATTGCHRHGGSMGKLLAFALLAIGCASIAPYNARIATNEKISSMSAAPGLPTPTGLEEYGAGVEKQWTETARRCTQVEIAIAGEIDDRQRRLTFTKRLLLGIGSVAAIATTIYTGITEDPKKEVIVPLAAIGGTAVATAIPALTEDDRVSQLQEKLIKINAAESVAIARLNAIEDKLHDRALLWNPIVRDTVNIQYAEGEQRDSIQVHLDSLYLEFELQEKSITPFEFELRSALAAWYDVCK